MKQGARTRFAAALLALAGAFPAFAADQATLLPPQCAGKNGALLDQCVRDLAVPTAIEQIEQEQAKPNPAAILNCNLVNPADQGFCIAHNEIAIECRQSKYPDFDACARRLITRPQPPRAAECSRVAVNQRELCAARNKVFADCLQNPWLYFLCLGDKLYAKK
jgi:hypothetical protein